MRVRIDRIEARAFLDGDSIGVRPMSAAAGPHRIGLDGSITITGPAPAFDLGLSGDLSVGLLAAWFPALPPGDGPLQITGRVRGPLVDPRFTYAASTAGLTVPDVRLPASSVEGYISRTGIYVERMRAGIGQGRVPATPSAGSRCSGPTYRWRASRRSFRSCRSTPSAWWPPARPG
jgi:hypothetical protein